MKLVGRGDTTVADAYLSPILRRYVDDVSRRARRRRAVVVHAVERRLDHGGPFSREGRDPVRDPPAASSAWRVPPRRPASTASSASTWEGPRRTSPISPAAYERSFETVVAGVRLRAPMMNIYTVAAGGGSICRFDGARFRVGPESAGANPGPASYRRGGPLTITDCNVMTGKLQPEIFPAVFGPRGDQPLDAKAVREKFARAGRRSGRRDRPAPGSHRDRRGVPDHRGR